MANDPPEEVQRWTAKRRVAVVVSLLKGETSVQHAAQKHGPTVAEVEDWQERFLLAAENGLRARPKDEEALKDEHIKKLKQKFGELVLDLDILKEAAKHRPFPGVWGRGHEWGDPLPEGANVGYPPTNRWRRLCRSSSTTHTEAWRFSPRRIPSSRPPRTGGPWPPGRTAY
jgi:hypothetical protein